MSSARRVKKLEAVAVQRKRWPLRAARRWCRRYASAHYENFAVVSLFLPSKLRPAYLALYAFARGADRRADDLFTEEEPEKRSQMRLAELALWRGELDRAFDGETPSHPAFISLQHVIREYGLERTQFDLMVDAFERDQSTDRYATWMDVLEYTRGSANPVGRWLLALHGEASDEKNRLSDDVCTGLQLVNFMQDIRSDLLDRGRIYLPIEELEQHGVSEEMLHEVPAPEAVRDLLRSEASRAEELLGKAGRLTDRIVNPSLQKQIRLFAGGGRLALGAIRDADYDVNGEHRRVSGKAKRNLLLKTLLRSDEQ